MNGNGSVTMFKVWEIWAGFLDGIVHSIRLKMKREPDGKDQVVRNH